VTVLDAGTRTPPAPTPTPTPTPSPAPTPRQPGPDVLVVGAGPVGLTAALDLVRRGLRVRVVDAAAGPASTSRAIAVHPRTLETFDQLGVVEEVLARSRHITAFTIVADGAVLARLDADYGGSPTRFPFTVTIEQVATEAVLRAALADRGVTVEWGVRLVDLDPVEDGPGVPVRLRHTTGEVDDEVELVVPAWVVGADGGHSTVRKVLGFVLTGTTAQTWLLADARVRTELSPDSIHLVRACGQTLMMAPLPGRDRWRLLDTVDVDHGDDPEEVARRFAAKLSAGTGHDVHVERPEWVSVFTAQQRMVADVRRGRVFLVGDAAHVHSPASGQGMNTGIQEAFNLAWKIAEVHRGLAGPDLLDTFATERLPVGRRLLDSTHRTTVLVTVRSALAARALPLLAGVVRRMPAVRTRVQRAALGRVSGLGVAYPDSALTRPCAPHLPGPRPGTRVVAVDPGRASRPGWRHLVALVRGTRWSLLVHPAGAEVAAAAADLTRRRGPRVDVRLLTDGPTSPAGDLPGLGVLPDPDQALRTDLGLLPGAWLLVRPDGYVAARGSYLTVAAVEAALVPRRTTTTGTDTDADTTVVFAGARP
jgi:NADPH-dependent dioxygenase